MNRKIASLIALSCLPPALFAAEIETSWTGSGISADWADEANWTNGVPDNAGDDLYNATIDFEFSNWPQIEAPVAVNNLTFPQGGVSLYQASLTVDGVTTLGGGRGPYGNLPVSFQVQSSTLDLGTVEAFAGGTLDRGSYSLGGVDSVLRWRNAAVTTIGPDASLQLQGGTATVRDSVTGNDALTGLRSVQGELSLTDRALTIAGDASVAGRVVVRADEEDASLLIQGTLAQNVGTTLEEGSVEVSSLWSPFAARVGWVGADVRTIGAKASVSLSGTDSMVVDVSTGESALKNLAVVEGSFLLNGQDFSTAGSLASSGAVNVMDASMTVNGALEVSRGSFSVSNSSGESSTEVRVTGGADLAGSVTVAANSSFSGDIEPSVARLQIDGPLAQQSGDTLTGGSLTVRYTNDGEEAPLPGTGASIAWRDADIRVIGAGAAVQLTGELSRIEDLSGNDALAGLAEIAGRFTLEKRTFATAGNLRLVGDPDNYYSSGRNLTVQGGAEMHVAGNLTNDRGSVSVGSYEYSTATVNTTLTVAGDLDNTGDLTIEGSNYGDGAAIGKVSVAGNLVQEQAHVLTAGNYSVASGDATDSAILEWTGADVWEVGERASVDIRGATAVVRDRVSLEDAFRNLREVNGSFSRSGTDLNFANGLKIGENGGVYLGSSSAPGNFQVTGDLDVAGQFSVTGNATITGAVPQNTAATLHAGRLSAQTGEISWSGARIDTIASGASVGLFGATSGIKNSANGADALAALSRVDGGFSVESRDFAVGALAIGSSGYIYVSNDYVSTNTLSISGNLSNEGSINVYGSASMDSAGGVVDIAGTVAQQDGTTLTGGSWYVSSGSNPGSFAEVRWNGANIRTIGQGAYVGLSGAGARIVNRSNGQDALAGLERVDGSFSVSSRVFEVNGKLTVGAAGWLDASYQGEIRIAGDFDLQGSLSLSGDAKIAVAGNSQFALDSSVTIFFDTLYDENYAPIGVRAGSFLVEGTAGLSGDLRLSISGVTVLPGADEEFVIVEAGSLSGAFGNLADAGRIDLYFYNYRTGEEEIAGSFLADYTSDSLVLKDFQAVPEPGAGALLLLGGLALAGLGGRRFRARSGGR